MSNKVKCFVQRISLASLLVIMAWPIQGLPARAEVVTTPFSQVPQGGWQTAQVVKEEPVVIKVLSPPPSKPPKSTLQQKIRLFGDVGYRYEYMDNANHLEGFTRYRPRYRLRINGYYKVNQYWEAGFRIMNADPRYPSTGWETFGQSPSPGEISGPESGSGRSGFVNFDRMYLNWTPNRWFKFQMGKQAIPIWKPWMVWGSSVWHDDDVQPAGTAEIFTLPAIGPFKSLKLVLGQFHLVEIQSTTTDTVSAMVSPTRGAHLWVQQLSGVTPLAPRLDFNWGVGFYMFDRLNSFANGTPQAMTAGTFRGRSTNQVVQGNCSPFGEDSRGPKCTEGYLSDWLLGNTSVELVWKRENTIRWAFDVVNNFGAKEDPARGRGKQGLAWLTHASYGDFREPGKIQFGAGYYWGQADATWAVYADDDYLNTNVNTIMFNVKWRIFKDVLVVWDNYIRRWNDPEIPIVQGIVPNAQEGNATFSSTRLTFVVSF